jgi:hypothetical protein
MTAVFSTFFYHEATNLVGEGLFIMGDLQSHSVGLLWMSYQLGAETTHNTHQRQIFMFPAGFETTTPVSERPQSHVLVRVATGIGSLLSKIPKYVCVVTDLGQ